MTNLDVTPVGPARDPQGRLVVQHRRGKVRIAAGVVLCVVAAGALATAIVRFSREQGALLDGAVATGRIGGEPVGFEAEAGDYTILMRTALLSNDSVAERDVARAVCTVRFAGGGTVRVNGNRQGVATVTDQARSIGVFQGVPGQATVGCTRRRGLQIVSREFVVSPGKASAATMGVPFGIAALAGLLGGLLIAWGFRGTVRTRN